MASKKNVACINVESCRGCPFFVDATWQGWKNYYCDEANARTIHKPDEVPDWCPHLKRDSHDKES